MLLVPEPIVLDGIEAEPIAPELLPMLLLSVPDGMDDAPEEPDVEPDEFGDVVEGLLVGAGVPIGVPVSSTFLPQAPRANKVERTTAVRARGLKFEACMSDSF